ncbi:MAG TPA: ferritin-like domain-containing protein [Polyangiaceae bacterium]|jgi:hypothetical protein|nr:ferritin-like domain-containing protein [Polyangiaceae bacterium]
MRARTRVEHEPVTLEAPSFRDPRERRAALKFFNAAYRAEQSGITQAHALATEVQTWDPELARLLELYGAEEGWHQELLESFLGQLGGGVQPMGRVTGLLFRMYGRVRRPSTIVLANLMFETIGSTTYRIALGRLSEPAVRQMLGILSRDESFHVPLNVFFLRRFLEREGSAQRARLRRTYRWLFLGLLLLPLSSRPKAGYFDRIGTLELVRAYAEQLARVFAREPELGLVPPWWLLRLLGLKKRGILGGAPARGEVDALLDLAADRANDAFVG